MQRPPTDRRRRIRRLPLVPLVGLLAVVGPAAAGAQSAAGLSDTKHNLSASGPGPIRADTESRICVFCHTPHNATPLSPLWNRELEPQNYQIYASPTLKAVPQAQPTGATKLCLSCHDGMIALGAVVQPAGGIRMSGGGTLPAGSLSDFGLDLSGHHPVSFAYGNALPDAELAATPPPELAYGADDEVHCTTCHDPHDDRFGRFLAKDHRHSALCTTCHQVPGWASSAHATNTDFPVAGILPRPPKSWPTWTTLAEWGCEACHTPHFAPTAPHLLNFTSAPPDPFSCTSGGCHASEPGPQHAVADPAAAGSVSAGDRSRDAGTDIASQVRKPSAHRERPGSASEARGLPGEGAASALLGVACADCHDPHQANRRSADAPYVSGRLEGVGGVDRGGAAVEVARYEYEICFRCHGDYSSDREFVPRVVASANARRDFDPDNPSYHPVVAPGRNLDLPSIPSTLEPSLTASEVIYCSACHADDEGGSRGPHGSVFAPILRDRYETADGTSESFESYALCYRCHERTSILANASFQARTMRTTPSGGGHSGHLAAGATCSACHDAHGVDPGFAPGAAGTGSHTHLINFDSRIVLPLPGAENPVFSDGGVRAGSCALACHGVTHDGWTYP